MVGTKTNGTNYTTNVPKANHSSINIMHGSVVSALSQSVSEAYYFFKLPPNCLIIDGILTGSQASGVSGQAVFQLGSNELGQKTLIGTFTVSGGAVLQQKLNIYQPITVSNSGSLHAIPISAIITSGASATTSLSLYLQLRYVMFGNLDGGSSA